MDGKALRLAMACAYAGHSAALGSRLRGYVSIEAAYAARQQWWPQESPDRQRKLAASCEAQYPWLQTHDSHNWALLAIGDAAYPPLLAQLADAPGVLFIRGDAALLCEPQLAMVGARAASAEGRSNARRLAAALANLGFVVTSGLAGGIDAEAHYGALQAGRTLAVMGTGPDRIYPARHHALAEKIVAQGGALVTEFPPGERAEKFHFPMRNRIISGLSLGVIVVEAAIKSGSLITARLAMNQGREVFALPGSVGNPLSRGGNLLLRDGANWLEEIADIRCVFGSMEMLAASTQEASLVRADRPELLKCFTAGTNSLDQLQRHSGLLMTDLLQHLADLELEGWVEKSPGGYQLCN